MGQLSPLFLQCCSSIGRKHEDRLRIFLHVPKKSVTRNKTNKWLDVAQDTHDLYSLVLSSVKYTSFISSHTTWSWCRVKFTDGEKEYAPMSRIEDILHIASVYQIPTAPFPCWKYRRIMLEGETQKYQPQSKSCACYVSWIKLILWGSTCWAWAAVTWMKIQA